MKKTLALVIGTIILYSCNNNKQTGEAPIEKASGATEVERPYEFGDSKYIDISKKGFEALSRGDVDGWMTGFADNAVYRWNSGDSLSGKAAISAYWKKRRSEVIDSLTFSNEIWLPIKLHKASEVIQKPGNYVLNWNKVTSKYKGGKTMVQWIHTILHYDENDWIDEVIQYLDRVPIQAAMMK